MVVDSLRPGSLRPGSLRPGSLRPDSPSEDTPSRGTRSEPTRTDRLFHALAHPTRRDIVVRTLGAEESVSALARHYPVSFAAIQRHVAVLEQAGLVTKRRRGREQLVRGDVEALRTASSLLDDIEAVWRARLARFGDALAEPADASEPTGSTGAPTDPTDRGAAP